MPFSFPASPSVGQQSTQNGRAYTWSGYAWEISVTSASIDATLLTGTIAAARLPLATTIAAGAIIVGTGLGVSSGTVSVTYGTTAGTACQGNDARLSDTRTPTDGSVTTAKIANSAVTYAKIQNVSATDRLLGRSSAGAGVVEEITCTATGRSLIGSADAAAARTVLSVQPTASPTFTGTVTVPGLTATAAILADDLSSTNSVVYSFDGDTNTGIGRAGADLLTLVTDGAERVRVDASGNVRIGTTGSDVTVTGERLSVLGGAFGVKTTATVPVGVWNTNTSGTRQYIYFYVNTGTLTGTINTDGTTTAYNTTSDYRLKTVSGGILDATSRLESLRPCEYVWNSTGQHGEGFLAHELAQSVPYAVTGEKDAVTEAGAIDPQQVDLSKIVPLLVAALQESNARIAALEERLNHA